MIIAAICIVLFISLILICWASAEYIDMKRFPVIPPWEPLEDPTHIAKVDLHQARVDFFSDEAIRMRPLWQGNPTYRDFVCDQYSDRRRPVLLDIDPDSIERELRAAIAMQAAYDTH